MVSQPTTPETVSEPLQPIEKPAPIPRQGIVEQPIQTPDAVTAPPVPQPIEKPAELTGPVVVPDVPPETVITPAVIEPDIQADRLPEEVVVQGVDPAETALTNDIELQDDSLQGDMEATLDQGGAL